MDSLRGLTIISSLGVGFTLGTIAYDRYMQIDEKKYTLGGCFSGLLGAALFVGGVDGMFNYLKNNKRITY